MRYQERDLSGLKAEFEEKLGKAKQETANASRISDKTQTIAGLMAQAEVFLEYGDVMNSLVTLRKVRSYVNIYNSPHILAVLKKTQFFCFSEEELQVVPNLFFQQLPGNIR